MSELKRPVNRETLRQIKRMDAARFYAWLNEYCRASYEDGLRDGTLSMLLKLHDEYGFGNERIRRLIELSDTWLQGIHEKDNGIDAAGIKAQLIAEGITCLKDTIL